MKLTKDNLPPAIAIVLMLPLTAYLVVTRQYPQAAMFVMSIFYAVALTRWK